MSRPLELTIWQQVDCGGPCKCVMYAGPSNDVAFPDVEAKRLTDAELAAEYQNSRLVSYVRHRRVDNYPGDMVLFDHYERGLEQEWYLERFATLPHYDEVPA